jgi:hypothetical protein
LHSIAYPIHSARTLSPAEVSQLFILEIYFPPTPAQSDSEPRIRG